MFFVEWGSDKDRDIPLTEVEKESLKKRISLMASKCDSFTLPLSTKEYDWVKSNVSNINIEQFEDCVGFAKSMSLMYDLRDIYDND